MRWFGSSSRYESRASRRKIAVAKRGNQTLRVAPLAIDGFGRRKVTSFSIKLFHPNLRRLAESSRKQ